MYLRVSLTGCILIYVQMLLYFMVCLTSQDCTVYLVVNVIHGPAVFNFLNDSWSARAD